MDNETSSVAPGSPDLRWKVSLGGICLAILCYGFFFSTNSSNNLWRLLAYDAPLALVIWLIFQIAVGRRHQTRHAGVTYLILLSALIASSIVGHYQQQRIATRTLSKMQQDLSGTASDSAENFGIRDCSLPESEPKARDEYGALMQFTATFQCRANNHILAYERDLVLAGWNTFLDANRISKDAGLRDSDAMLDKFRTIVATYRQGQQDLLQSARSGIRDLGLSDASRTVALGSFEKSITIRQPEIAAQWEREALLVEEHAQVVALLKSNMGAWTASEGRIRFSSDDGQRAFEAYVAVINSTLATQRAIRQQAADRAARSIDDIEK